MWKDLTDFGGIAIPTSLEDLLADLSDITFNTFTMEEAFAILSDWDIASNPTVFITMFTLLGLDIITLFLLGAWRGRRRYQHRLRNEQLHEGEQVG